MGKQKEAKNADGVEHITKSGGNVFADIGFGKAEAANLKIRAELIIALEKHVAKKKLKQREAAELFGISRPAVSDLVTGKVSKFSIDKLVTMLARAGKTVKVKVA